MDDTLARLEAEYCPPLDPSLLAAIVLDYELSSPTGLASARQTLDELKESAALEEQTGFDPSGTGAPDQDGLVGKRPESCPETSASLSRETDITSLSNGVSSLDLGSAALSDGDAEAGFSADAESLEMLDDGMKVQLLQDLFAGQVTRYSIEHTFKKCNGKWNAAMEELLNHVYFSENEKNENDAIKAKGIDGFSEDFILPRTRKPRGKKKSAQSGADRKTASLPESRNISPERQVNKWKSASEDIDFISSRTGIAKSTVSSAYYEKGASVPQTIGTLLKASMEESRALVTDDDSVSVRARDLGREFPTIAPHYLSTIIRVTHPSPSSAHELATALTAKPTPEGGIQIVPRLAPLNGLDSADDWQPVSRRAKYSSTSPSSSDDMVPASVRQNAYAVAQATAFAQASAAHRKAKSNHLMGGAAAYYGQVGREYAALSASASAAAADDLAHTQSSATQLDLHGIDVQNGVRIAREKVEGWWDDLGERRVNGRAGAEDRQAGYRIVVGLGRHSEGGKGKLGPAVTKMLKAEGWRIEGEGAVIVVKGPVRR